MAVQMRNCERSTCNGKGTPWKIPLPENRDPSILVGFPLGTCGLLPVRSSFQQAPGDTSPHAKCANQGRANPVSGELLRFNG